MKNYFAIPFGLGDLAYYIFRPAVYTIDFVWGTDLKDCEVCHARREKWNSIGVAPAWMLVVAIATAVFLCI